MVGEMEGAGVVVPFAEEMLEAEDVVPFVQPAHSKGGQSCLQHCLILKPTAPPLCLCLMTSARGGILLVQGTVNHQDRSS